MISFGNGLRIFFVFLTLIGVLWKNPPTEVFLEDSFCSVTWSHPFGCDRLGRDVYSLFLTEQFPLLYFLYLLGYLLWRLVL